MKNLVFLLLAGGTFAKPATVGEGVALDCGTTLSLSEREQPTVIFSNVPSDSKVCIFTVEAPKDLHVELTCDSPTATANGQDAYDFRGEGPVVIEFRPTAEQPQLSCRAGLEEAHMEEITNNDIDIDDFDYACNKQPKDKERRRKILAENEKKLRDLNADSSSTWTARVTCMSDMTHEEVVTTHTGRGPPPPQDEMDRRSKKAERELLAPLRSFRTTLPASVDLTADGRVSAPKEQGNCGSCSVFAAVSTIESCMHKATNNLPTDLSEQHMMDCAYGVGGRGCDGGMADQYNEWMYRDHNGGLANEAQYPYLGYTTGTNMCRNSTVAIANHGALVTSHQESWNSTEEDIMRLLSQGYSVTTGMQTVDAFENFYGSGVFQSNACKNCRNADGSVNNFNCPQNHDITIVGYGEENGVKFWKLKNSWGIGWGERGFAKILRGKGHCGLGIDFSVPICTASVINNCMTVSGADPGANCVFPFTFKGEVYTECTTVDSPDDETPWCSTLTDENGNHVGLQGKWGYCAPNCNEGGVCVNDNSTMDKLGDSCSWYDANPWGCGDYDTDTFTASIQCCVCK